MNALGFAHQTTLHEASSGGQDPIVYLSVEQVAVTEMRDPAGDTKPLSSSQTRSPRYSKHPF